MVFPTFFNLSLNLAIRSLWSEPLSSAQPSQLPVLFCWLYRASPSHRSVCHTYILFHILLYCDLSRDIKHSSLHYAVLVLSCTIVSDSVTLRTVACLLIHPIHNNLLLLIPNSQSFPSLTFSLYASFNPQVPGAFSSSSSYNISVKNPEHLTCLDLANCVLVVWFIMFLWPSYSCRLVAESK